MARILRGEVRWAELDPVRGREQAGHRPVLILSHDVFNANSDTVIAVSVTSKAPKAGFPLIVDLPPKALGKPAWVKVSQIRTLSVLRIGKCLGTVSTDEIGRVMLGLNEILGE
jgi:mRNA interferase MazF